MIEIQREIIDTIEDAGFSIYIDNETGSTYDIELEYYCGNGMDFVTYISDVDYSGNLSVDAKMLATGVQAYVDSYDADEECEIQLQAPDRPSISQVLEDCDEAGEALQNLADALYRLSKRS